MIGRLLMCALLVAACGKSESAKPDAGGKATAKPPVKPSVTPPVVPITYEDSVTGLEQMAKDLMTATRGGNPQRSKELLFALKLPDYENWFIAHFGKELGQRAAEEYKPFYEDIGLLEVVLMQLSVDEKQEEVEGKRIVDPNDPEAVGYQSEALLKMIKPVPLYSVRYKQPNGQKVFHLWSFVYEKGTFRYVGKMLKAVNATPPPAGQPDPKEFRPGGLKNGVQIPGTPAQR
jgi:hypothetical protein